MKTKYIDFTLNKEGKIPYLTDILPQIHTKTILYKKITGLGATYGELSNTNRSSIIVEPNVPVIAGKCSDPKHKKHNLFGVYEGVYTKDIVNFIEKSGKKHFKLLTTPESFRKIKDAFEILDLDIYSTCFLLFDECHKIVKDVDYRSDITLPLDDFFEFENKALVSATPIGLSDPRFNKQGFQTIELRPQGFEYKKDINVRWTNNVLQLIRELRSKMKEEGHLFFFVNSTDMIYSLMEQLNILDESTVFCAPKSVSKLKERKFKKAYNTWKKQEISRYNFLTSRFFNAFDLELEEQPDIYIISDVYVAEHSMIDPFTDTIQIAGRFRNGVSSINHICNTNKDLPQRSLNEIKLTVRIFEGVYATMKRHYDVATNRAVRDALSAIMNILPFKSMLDKEGRKNWFLIDNYMDEAKLKGYYHDKESLLDAYRGTDMFYVSSYVRYYKLSDLDKLKIEDKSQSIKEKRAIIVSQLGELEGDTTNLAIEYKRTLIDADAFIVEAYDTLGRERIEELNYSQPQIREAMILKRFKENSRGTEVVELIKNSFKVGQKYRINWIKSEIKRIYKLCNVHPPKAVTSDTINEYFNTDLAYIKKNRALLLISEKI